MENFEEFKQEVVAEIKANPHMYPSVCRGMVAKIEAQQVEITTLTHDLANERVASGYAKQMKEELERLRNVNELDRSVVADGLAGMRRAIKGREWLRLGRGSYEYDDDRWRDEFAEALNAIEDAMKPLETVARNISDCPTTQAGANTARELLTRANKAEAERDKYKDALERIAGHLRLPSDKRDDGVLEQIVEEAWPKKEEPVLYICNRARAKGCSPECPHRDNHTAREFCAITYCDDIDAPVECVPVAKPAEAVQS